MEIINKKKEVIIHISKRKLRFYGKILKGIVCFLATIPVGLIIGFLAAFIYNL